MFQSTLKNAVSFEGIGAHSGKICRVSIEPAESEISFLKGGDVIAANFSSVLDSNLCTKLSAGGASVATVEHLLAAFYGLGVTAAAVRVDGDELPITDGSALPFVEMILSVGIRKIDKKRKTLRVLRPVKIQEGEKWETLSPSDSFTINIECDYAAKGLKTDPISFDFATGDFAKEIAPARTFGFFAEAEFLRKNNLALGSSLENAVVFDECGRPLNKDGLRLDNEPVRHKILDVVGDLSLAGFEIKARFDAFCPSHKTNHELLRRLFEDDENYEITEE
ncbi:MAG: UDP-3-O-acyl-N-acetylglucosamine deacetylase [Holosporaceae bacterium]|nr:UDP-3-O-acyl-N-acetylglucosamine deacetylase [Holosporaceae bacterium]